MAEYTQSELTATTATLGPAAPVHAEQTDLLNGLLSFSELLSLVAWTFIRQPDLVFSFMQLSVRSLLLRLTDFLALLPVLEQLLADLGRAPSPVRSVAQLERALSSARSLESALALGQLPTALVKRLSTQLESSASAEFGPALLRQEELHTSPAEASARALNVMASLEEQYRLLLPQAQRLLELRTDWEGVFLGPLAGRSAAASIRSRLEEIQSSPDSQQRSALLDLLTAAAHLTFLSNPPDPFANRVESAGLAAGTGTPARLYGDTSAPFRFSTGSAALVLRVDSVNLDAVQLPCVTPATARSKRLLAPVILHDEVPATLRTLQAGPWGETWLHTDSPCSVSGDIVSGAGAWVLEPGQLIMLQPHADGYWGRVLDVLDAAVGMWQVQLEPGHSVPTGGLFLCDVGEDNRLSLYVDGQEQLCELPPHPASFSAAQLVTLWSATLAGLATVEELPGEGLLFTSLGVPGQASIVAGALSPGLNTLFGWLGGEGSISQAANNVLTVEIDGVSESVYLGVGSCSLLDILSTITTHPSNVAFQLVAAASSSADGRLLLQSRTCAAATQGTVLVPAGAAQELLGFSPQQRYLELNPTTLSVVAAINAIPGVACATLLEERGHYQLTLNSDGSFDPVPISADEAGCGVELSGAACGMYHVVGTDPLTLSPALRADQLPAAGTTYVLSARFFMEELQVSSRNTGSTSSIAVLSAPSALGLAENWLYCGTVTDWADSTVHFLRLLLQPGDVFYTEQPVPVSYIGEGIEGGQPTPPPWSTLVAAVTDTQLSLADEIAGWHQASYYVRSRGLDEYLRLCEDEDSPLTAWGLLLEESIYGFSVGLSQLSSTVRGAASGNDQARRRALQLAAALRQLWTSLFTLLSTPTFAAPILEEAWDILDTLSEWGAPRGRRLLEEARFSEFFTLTLQRATDSGDVSQDLHVLRDTDFVPSQVQAALSPFYQLSEDESEDV